jgi:predicted DsbA family dithiol-disulfide isomerase
MESDGPKNVAEDITLAKSLGLSGTPAFLVGTSSQNRHTLKVHDVIRGAENYEQFVKVIERLLASEASERATRFH